MNVPYKGRQVTMTYSPSKAPPEILPIYSQRCRKNRARARKGKQGARKLKLKARRKPKAIHLVQSPWMLWVTGRKLACLIKAAPPPPITKNTPWDSGANPRVPWWSQAARRLQSCLALPLPHKRLLPGICSSGKPCFFSLPLFFNQLYGSWTCVRAGEHKCWKFPLLVQPHLTAENPIMRVREPLGTGGILPKCMLFSFHQC